MKKIMKWNLQQFKKSSSTTYSYTPSAEEKALLSQQLKYQNAFFPNVIKLNDNAGKLLWDSYGTVQADYDTMNANAQQQIAAAQSKLSNLSNGVLPSAYKQNMTDAIQGTVNNTVGNAVNTLGNRGVLNSSVTGAALGDISKNVADVTAQNFNNNVSTLSQLGQQQIGNANAAITTSAAAQEAAQQPAINLWNASLGLQQSGNQVLGNIAGKYGTGVQSTSQPGGFGSFLGGVASGLAGNSGFWGYLGNRK